MVTPAELQSPGNNALGFLHSSAFSRGPLPFQRCNRGGCPARSQGATAGGGRAGCSGSATVERAIHGWGEPAAGARWALGKEGAPSSARSGASCTRRAARHPHAPPPTLAVPRNHSTGQNAQQVPSFYLYLIRYLKQRMTHVGLCQDQQHQASFV